MAVLSGSRDAVPTAEYGDLPPAFGVVRHDNLVNTLLRPWIMSSHRFATAVTKRDGPVRVFGHHGSKQPTSNSKPTLRNGAGCLRDSLVAFGVLGNGAVSVATNGAELRLHSPGARHANVTAITEEGDDFDVCPWIADARSLDPTLDPI
jgi:hypothetical protein